MEIFESLVQSMIKENYRYCACILDSKTGKILTYSKVCSDITMKYAPADMDSERVNSMQRKPVRVLG